MSPKKPASPSKGSSHAARAAALLSKARAQASASSTINHPSTSLSASSLSPSPYDSMLFQRAMPLPDLIKQLSTKGGLTLREAMAVAGKLVNARCTTPEALSQISLIMLQDIGIESEEQRKRTVLAFKGKKAAGIHTTSDSSDIQTYRKRRRISDDETLSREYGNVSGPNEKGKAAVRATVAIDYIFNEILDIESLRGRYAVVNRAPVMTVWATILLEKFGFSRAEALSLAHCYVNYTSTSRGISLGIIPTSERDKPQNNVGPNQPHFELMGVKIPIMKMQDETYRGIRNGEVVDPEKAFQYMRRSMAQTLPSIFGALTLLADSYMNPPSADSDSVGEKERTDLYGAEYLVSQGYDLYVEFRPFTSGEWGKKGRLWYDKVLALRRGRQEEFKQWKQKEIQLDQDVDLPQDWSKDIERLVNEELEGEHQDRMPTSKQEE